MEGGRRVVGPQRHGAGQEDGMEEQKGFLISCKVGQGQAQ